MTSYIYLVIGKIVQTVLDYVDSSQFVHACHRIFNIRKQYINDVIIWIYTKYCCFLKREYRVINNVRAKKGGAHFFMGHHVYP